jgi:hypothetical protein
MSLDSLIGWLSQRRIENRRLLFKTAPLRGEKSWKIELEED